MKNEGLYFRTRDEWRTWLEGNSQTSDGIWMRNYKKHTGMECVTYPDAVEEALCFGWIDGKIKRINDEYFVRYYTPRRPGSRWSKYNIERVEKLKKAGMMTPVGLEAFNVIFKNPKLIYDNRLRTGEPEIPEELLAALKSNKIAFENFMKFSQSARRLYIEWYKYAKQDKTRLGRIQKIIRFSEENRRPGMM
ncbi:MAG: YdeI/OmpD-associated family protein [Bacteroidota bacterium]|nr:YdeI/OmpD-associated family protein [Bacteroidota bacterium]